jgi:hypothetical protein
MQEELEIELVHVAACVAGARRVQPHGAERVGKTAVDALDGIERKLALRQVRVGQIGERRIALQIGQDDRGFDFGKNALEQRIENSLRMLELRTRQEYRVAGDIGNEEKARLRHSRHSLWDRDAKYGLCSRKLRPMPGIEPLPRSRRSRMRGIPARALLRGRG